MTPVGACPACNRIVRALIGAAQKFGLAASQERSASERVCADHLPLVVGFTAPRVLGKWLLWALESRNGGHAAFDTLPCVLCQAEAEVDEEARGIAAANPCACLAHGGRDELALSVLREPLARIAAGERIGVEEERTALRAGLVAYASLRGSAAFIPRIE